MAREADGFIGTLPDPERLAHRRLLSQAWRLELNPDIPTTRLAHSDAVFVCCSGSVCEAGSQMTNAYIQVAKGCSNLPRITKLGSEPPPRRPTHTAYFKCPASSGFKQPFSKWVVLC